MDQTYSARSLAKETGIPLATIIEHAKEMKLPTAGKTLVISAPNAVRIMERANAEEHAETIRLQNKIENGLIWISRLAPMGGPNLMQAAAAALDEHRGQKWNTGKPVASARPAAARLHNIVASLPR